MDKFASVLETLAEKLGTTTEQLVPTYVGHIQTCGIVSLATCGLAMLIGAGLIAFGFLWAKKQKNGVMAEPSTGMPVAIGIVVFLIALIIAPAYIPGVVDPEGAALVQIMSFVRNVAH